MGEMGLRKIRGQVQIAGVGLNGDTGFSESVIVSIARVDQMTERAAERICHALTPLDDLAARLATEWPDAPALELTVAMASAAQGVQSMLQGDGPCGGRAQKAWELAALVAAEVHYLQVTGWPHATAGDLLEHWAREASGG